MEQHPHKFCYASVSAKQVTLAGITYAKFSVPKLSQPPIKKYVIHPNEISGKSDQEQMVPCRMGSHHSFITSVSQRTHSLPVGQSDPFDGIVAVIYFISGFKNHSKTSSTQTLNWFEICQISGNRGM